MVEAHEYTNMTAAIISSYLRDFFQMSTGKDMGKVTRAANRVVTKTKWTLRGIATVALSTSNNRISFECWREYSSVHVSD